MHDKHRCYWSVKEYEDAKAERERKKGEKAEKEAAKDAAKKDKVVKEVVLTLRPSRKRSRADTIIETPASTVTPSLTVLKPC